MPSRLNWTHNEDLFLKHLRDQQMLGSWQEIATKLNSKFHFSQRSAKQCRERFTNNVQFYGHILENKAWSKEEDKILMEVYLQSGSRWSIFIKHFQCRSENSIKNRFYCCLKKATRKLRELEGKNFKIGSKSIKYEMVTTILELTNKVERESEKLLDIIPSKNLNLFLIRRVILQISFLNTNLESPEVIQVINGLHIINTYLRTLGIFKPTKKGQWELTQKRLQYILSFENSLNFEEKRMPDDPKYYKCVQKKQIFTSFSESNELDFWTPNKGETQNKYEFDEIWDFDKQFYHPPIQSIYNQTDTFLL